MTFTIAIKTVATCIIVLMLFCLVAYFFTKRSKAPRVPSYSDRAIACLRSDPEIARIVLTLTHLERSSDRSHVRRKKSFLVLELMNRLKVHFDDRAELKHVCIELVRMAVNVSKVRDEQSRKS
jgi:hypothetical protein